MTEENNWISDIPL